MKSKSSLLVLSALLGAISPAAAQYSGAAAGSTDDAAHSYNNSANWTGGTVNDTFLNTPALSAATTLYFNADRTTVANANGNAGLGLHLGYGGGNTLTLQGGGTDGGAPAADHTLTLGGNVYLANAGNQTTIIGSTTAGSALNVNLGGSTRTFGGNAAGRSVRLLNQVTNGGIIVTDGIRLELGGKTNNFTGGIVVKNGTLASFGETSNTTPFGSGTITLGDTSGSASATLSHIGGSTAVSNPILVAAGSSGVLSIAPTNGNNTYSGPITLANNLRIAPATGGSNNFTGGITGTGNLSIENGNSNTSFSGQPLNFTGSITHTNVTAGKTLTISSVIGANVTTVTQNGTVPMVLNAANAYTGGTLVNSGAVTTGTLGTLGSGNITVANAAAAVLTLGNANGIANTAALLFGAAATINLNFSGADALGAITNTGTGTSIGAGTYTAAQLNSFFGVTSFLGTGSLTVIPEPAVASLIGLGLGLLTLGCRRKRQG